MSGANFVFLGGRFQAPFSLEYGRYAPVARLMLLLWLPPFIHIYIYKYIYIYIIYPIFKLPIAMVALEVLCRLCVLNVFLNGPLDVFTNHFNRGTHLYKLYVRLM